MDSAIEDFRPALNTESFTKAMWEANDELDYDIQEIVEERVDAHNINHQSSAADRTEQSESFDTQFDSEAPTMPVSGDRLEVFLPLDGTYYAGSFDDIDNSSIHHIVYDYEEEEKLEI